MEDTEVAALVQGGLGLQVPAMVGITILVEEEQEMIGGETRSCQSRNKQKISMLRRANQNSSV